MWWEGPVCCVVHLTHWGSRAGYCRVPEGHPWHGLHHTDAGPVLLHEFDGEILSEEALDDFGAIPLMVAAMTGSVDEFACTPAGQIRVHGGVTYAGPLRFVVGAPRGWWFGFDCAHADDAPEPDHPHTQLLRDGGLLVECGTVRTLEFVQFECKRMATSIMAGMRAGR
jgi:hypothetical protein